MRKLSAVVVCFGLCASVLVSADKAISQTSVGFSGPAEIPPASFRGNQYVDSSGCAFIRAGGEAMLNWVPRVNRDRQPICGFRPTLVKRNSSGAGTSTVSAPSPTRNGIPVLIPDQEPVASPSTTARAAPPVEPNSAPTAILEQAFARKVTIERPKVLDANIVRIPSRRGAAPLSGLPPSKLTSVERAPRSAPMMNRKLQVNNNTQIMPLAVYRSRALNTGNVKIPPGYERIWDDDRLNPKRGLQTIGGYKATSLIWSNTVPRRLIDRSNGKDMGPKFPKLVYPFTDAAQQAKYFKSVDEYSVVVKKRTGAVRLVPKVNNVAAASSRSAPQIVQPTQRRASKARTGRYFVQVGVFGVQQNAQTTKARLHAANLPVARAATLIGGKTMQSVLAGPFSSKAKATAALAHVKNLGFLDAYIR